MPAGRRNFFDEDEDRLPAGMRRVGYDEGTQRYTFREGNQLWLGEPGSFYGGTMRPAGTVPVANVQPQEDLSGDEPDPVPTDSSRSRPLLTSVGSGVAALKRHASRFKDAAASTVVATSVGSGAALKRSASRFKDAATSTVEATSASGVAALKRHASRFKDAAASTVMATGVVRNLTGKEKPIRHVQQGPGEMGETKYDVEREQDGTRQANAQQQHETQTEIEHLNISRQLWLDKYCDI